MDNEYYFLDKYVHRVVVPRLDGMAKDRVNLGKTNGWGSAKNIGSNKLLAVGEDDNGSWQ